MGYEILFTYHEQVSKGVYKTEETKTMKKKIGDPFEDVDLDKCAAAILAQFARRDILVTDVEVYELAKKKITFKESKGAITLKNKKYQTDGAAGIIGQEITEAPAVPATSTAVAQVPGRLPAGAHPHNRGPLKPIKWVLYQPTIPKEMNEDQKRKYQMLKFTLHKRYPVFSEQLQLNGIGMAYKTVDDNGREQLISDEYFVPADQNLVKQYGPDAESDGGALNWGGAYNDDSIPALR